MAAMGTLMLIQLLLAELPRYPKWSALSMAADAPSLNGKFIPERSRKSAYRGGRKQAHSGEGLGRGCQRCHDGERWHPYRCVDVQEARDFQLGGRQGGQGHRVAPAPEMGTVASMQRSRVVLRPRHTFPASLTRVKRTPGMVPLLPPPCVAQRHSEAPRGQGFFYLVTPDRDV